MSIPTELLYHKSHEWVKIEGDEAIIGISDFAQHSLGDITYVEVPDIGGVFAAGDELGAIESVKAASELYSPVSGEVIAVNEVLADTPELVNQSPYDKGWIVRIKLSAQPEGLLDAKDYEALCVEDH